ncbi:MAG: phosphoenolpyruvate carboxykinase domain-containing protein, partial [Candidatus Omnitrophica bacterium]|nr:phosphoenolpyruvate carboxykinase domain-containing protein [Candidatus Omnitrophota bacterium]
ESETTAATLGQEGVRVFNPMSNMDFLAIPLGKYIQRHLDFGKGLKQTNIYSVNYFLKNSNGQFLNGKDDKRVWLKWMRERADGSVGALLTPTGLIPKYNDLKQLFKDVLNKEYSKDDYLEQFSLRVDKNLAKIERMRNIYTDLSDIPEVLFNQLKSQEQRLIDCQREFGNYVKPENFKEV